MSSNDTVITVENISKAYLLGQQEKHDTVFGSMAAMVKAPVNNLRRLVRLNTFNLAEAEPVDTDDILWALKDVSFEVKRGESLGIIGRNGAGKSTLLKILSRVAEPTRGRIHMKGRVSALLEVGTGFHPELTGRENIYLNGTILGMKKTEIDRKFDEIVDFSGVERFLDTPVKRYSSGMRVRLAFAVAAHLEPEILIVDEVLAVGDAEFQKKCLGKMQEVTTGEGRTVLFVSHNMGAVQALCKRGILIMDGRIETEGLVENVVSRYIEGFGKVNYGSADLTNHPGRRPGMLEILKKVSIRRRDSLDSSTLVTGKDALITIEYDCGDLTDDYRAVNRAFIGISSSSGERIISVGTHLDTNFNESISGSGEIICNLPNLPLYEGEYLLLVAIGTKLPPVNIDSVDNAVAFKVTSTSFFGAATLVSGQGYIAQKSYWQVNKKGA